MGVLLIKNEPEPGFGEFSGHYTVKQAVAWIRTLSKGMDLNTVHGVLSLEEIEQKLTNPGHAIQVKCNDQQWIIVRTSANTSDFGIKVEG